MQTALSAVHLHATVLMSACSECSVVEDAADYHNLTYFTEVSLPVFLLSDLNEYFHSARIYSNNQKGH